jgi:hypothetical protein
VAVQAQRASAGARITAFSFRVRSGSGAVPGAGAAIHGWARMETHADGERTTERRARARETVRRAQMAGGDGGCCRCWVHACEIGRTVHHTVNVYTTVLSSSIDL